MLRFVTNLNISFQRTPKQTQPVFLFTAKVTIRNVTDKRALTREEVAEKGIRELMVRYL